jgi:hypothetical protein
MTTNDQTADAKTRKRSNFNSTIAMHEQAKTMSRKNADGSLQWEKGCSPRTLAEAAGTSPFAAAYFVRQVYGSRRVLHANHKPRPERKAKPERAPELAALEQRVEALARQVAAHEEAIATLKREVILGRKALTSHITEPNLSHRPIERHLPPFRPLLEKGGNGGGS